VPSDGDPETRRCRVGARIGRRAADLGATDAEPGAGAWPARDRDGAINIIGGSHAESHPDSFSATGRNDSSRGRTDDLRRNQVELETGHGECALQCLEPMPRPIILRRSERGLESATARRPRIAPRTARDRERLCLRPYGLYGCASCCLAHRDIDRSLPSDLESDRVRESLTETGGARGRPQVHLESEGTGHAQLRSRPARSRPASRRATTKCACRVFRSRPSLPRLATRQYRPRSRARQRQRPHPRPASASRMTLRPPSQRFNATGRSKAPWTSNGSACVTRRLPNSKHPARRLLRLAREGARSRGRGPHRASPRLCGEVPASLEGGPGSGSWGSNPCPAALELVSR
jgi:hypothetical protein